MKLLPFNTFFDSHAFFYKILEKKLCQIVDEWQLDFDEGDLKSARFLLFKYQWNLI